MTLARTMVSGSRRVLVFGIASTFAFGSAGAQREPNSTHLLALVGGRIYPSPEAPPVDNGVVLVRHGLIAAIGTAGAVAIPGQAKRIDCSGSVILAGFWNSHVHFTEAHWARADTLPAKVLAAQLRTMLTGYGFVSALDTGSPLQNTLILRRRVDSGELPGPAIRTTGPGFAPRGASPFYILPDHLPELRSAADAKSQVAARVRQGADAIKLFTGSFASPTNIIPMPVDIVTAATTEAHRHGRLVLAHPSNDAGLRAALDGGVDVLAHTTPEGTPWAPSLVQRMRRAHLALVPTLKLWTFELSRKKADAAAIHRFLSVAIQQLHEFLASGGEVLFGTDVGYMTDYDPTDEYVYMEQAGASFRQVLAALTTAPANRFGRTTRTTGRLQVGEPADIVVLAADPATDIRALARVRYVLRQGRTIYQADGVASQ